MRHSLAAIGLFALLTAAAQPALSQTPTFAGTWKLNAKESDDAKEKLELATSSTMRMTDGMSSSRRPRTSAGSLDGEKGGGRDERPVGNLPGPDFARVMRPAAQITVEQNDTVVIVNDGGLPQVFYLDGRKVEEQMPGAEPRQITAKLAKDGKLTVERKLGGSGSIKEVFILDAEKGRLVVEAKLTSPTLGKTLEIRRVYDSGS
jgi:hypothetical protein